MFSNKGKQPIGRLEVPLGPDGMTLGYALVEYADAETATAALERLQGFKLDNKHTFAVNSMSDYERLARISTDYIEPSENEVRANMPPGTGDDLKWFVCDALGRDQFVIKHGDTVSVKWNDALAPPATLFERRGWTRPSAARTYRGLPELEWSPRGSYLITFADFASEFAHAVELWGSERNVCIRRFEHPNVVSLAMSPGEKYLVTYAPNDRNDPAVEGTIVWDVTTGRKLDSIASSSATLVFTPDDAFCCCVAEDGLYAYDMSNFNFKKPRTITVRNMDFFTMSPADPILAAWVPESPNSPSRIVLVDVATGREVRQKNLVQVQDVCSASDSERVCVSVCLCV